MVAQTVSTGRPLTCSTIDRTAGVVTTCPEAGDAVESTDDAGVKHGWRFVSSDHAFHAFTEGQERSLCGAHLLGRHGATACGDNIPPEVKCPFCVALVKRV